MADRNYRGWLLASARTAIFAGLIPAAGSLVACVTARKNHGGTVFYIYAVSTDTIIKNDTILATNINANAAIPAKPEAM